MKSYNVLMVQPKTPRTFWTLDKTVKAGGRKTIMPPLGLMTIAALLPSHYHVKILDLNTTPLDENEVVWADLVFVTGMYIHHTSFVEVVRLAKKLQKTVVAGGPLAIAESIKDRDRYGHLLDVDHIDHLVLYEAEVNLPLFLQDWEQGRARKTYADRNHPDLGATPPPRFDLINVNDYLIMTLQFSRGCPHNCDFCDVVSIFGRVPRTKPIEQFINEMDRLYNTGFRGVVFIVDDNLIGNKKVARRLLAEMAVWQEQHDYPFVLLTQATLLLASDDALLQLMVKAGFFLVFVGIETPDIDTLRASNKTINTHFEMDKAVEKIQRAGIEVMGGFVIGFDTDTPDIFERQMDFIQNAVLPRSMVGLLSPIPGTVLYERLERENRVLDTFDHGKVVTGDNVVPALYYAPTMPAEQLMKGYNRLLSEIYHPARYFERSLTLISRLPDLRVRDLSKKERWRQKRARARAHLLPVSFTLVLGIVRIFFTARGFYFARFLARSAGYGLMALPVAFDLALSGEHFFSLSEKVREALASVPRASRSLADSDSVK